MGNCGPSKLRESQTQQSQERRPLERIKVRSVNSSTGVSTPDTCSEASDEDSSKSRHVKHTSLVKDCLEPGQLRSCTVVHNKRIEDLYDGVHDGKVLGVGLSGVVRRIKHRETGVTRALKVLDLKGLARNDIDTLLGEIKIMCSLDHPNVVCLEEVFEGEDELFLTQELCRGGDLFDRLGDQPNYSYKEADCVQLIRQMLSSIRYLHSKGIIHRDLKLENFLFSDTKSGHSELKLIDFGLSKHFEVGDIHHELVGTLAPEVAAGQGYDEKADLFSIGVLTFLLLSGESPFGGDRGEDADMMMKVRDRIIACAVPYERLDVSDLAVDFIKSLLVRDPSKRPTARQAQNHPWVRQRMIKQPSVLKPSVVNGLTSFKDLSATRKFLREVVTYTLDADQIEGLHRVFDGLKIRQKNDTIRWHEFLSASLSQCHIEDKNVRLAFSRLSDGKNYITLHDLRDALLFYGSDDSLNDLQRMWLSNIADYKINKDKMTLEDFRRLLTIEGLVANGCDSPQSPQLAQLETRPKALTRSFKSPEETIDKSEFIDTPIDKPIKPTKRSGRCRRSTIDSGTSHVQEVLTADMRRFKDMQNPIIETAGRDSPSSPKVRKSRGLLMRRASIDYSDGHADVHLRAKKAHGKLKPETDL
ncbi:hypothetical protein THAOC_28001 [Thalassiosira oceanica]|uniref:Protein kinase domain-containing protein n=1 Tax=Thalassiosira oceanica TaxID=159749 RepID=K0S1I8_THAOC|nr:hypothetical protein THAOC_28001 [Thalassiosira oceanica]|eukprot:EJK52697.1 hypothetical protein THAOC_28001 [Thalassiosira oceanica]